MKMVIVALVFAFAFTTRLEARAIPVISGEHDDFTRLVAFVPSGVEWNLDQSDQQAQLILENWREGFELEQVFEKIPRTRLGAVTGGPDRMSLMLNCDCIVKASRYQESMVVIDILTVESTKARKQDQGLGWGTLLDQNSRLGSEVTFPTRVGQPNQQADPIPREVQDLPPHQDIQALPDRLSVDAEILMRSRQELAEQFAEASSSGLLAPATPSLPLMRSLDAQIDTSVFELSPIVPVADEDSVLNELTDSIRVTSSVDMDIPDSWLEGEGVRTSSCPDPDTVDIRQWGTADGFAVDISRGHGSLFGEFDRLSEDAVVRLAKTYAYYGFGAEVRKVLQMADLAAAHPELVEISYILDDADGGDSVLRQHGECADNLALWALLAEEQVDRFQSLDTAAILRALSLFPLHLRRNLGPRISDRLLAYGDEDAAAMALRSLGRLPEDPGAAMTMAEAALADQQGHGEIASEKLEEVVEANSELSGVALLKLAEAQLETGVPLTVETLALVESYIHEARGTPDQAPFQKVVALSAAYEGDFELALTKAELLESSQKQTVEEIVYAEIVHKAEDLTFLLYALDEVRSVTDNLTSADKLVAAERLLSLGFPEIVQEVVESFDDSPTSDARHLLAAKAALALEQPALALASLFEIASDEANLLRARAYEMSGDYGAAEALFRSLDDVQAADTQAWLAGRWGALVESETSLAMAALSNVAAESLPSIEPNQGLLSQSNSLLEDSALARETIESSLRSEEFAIE